MFGPQWSLEQRIWMRPEQFWALLNCYLILQRGSGLWVLPKALMLQGVVPPLSEQPLCSRLYQLSRLTEQLPLALGPMPTSLPSLPFLLLRH